MSKTERMTHKLTLTRYNWFIDQIHRGKNPNTRTMAEALEISQVQAQRDIEFMRDQLKVPLEYVHEQKGYTLTDERFSLPAVWIEEDELLLLAVAKEMIGDGDARELLHSLFTKILPTNSKTTMETVSGLISYKGSGHYFHPGGILGHLVSVMLESRAAAIRYRPVFGKTPETFTLRIVPRHLIFYKGNWYLLAHYQKQLRTYALSRIEEVVAGEPAQSCDMEVIRNRIAKAFGIYITDDQHPLQTVRLCFDPAIAGYIETIAFHPGQTLTRLEDDRLEVSFPSTLNRELIGEVLRFIDSVEIVEPAELRLEIQLILKKGLEKLAEKSLVV